MIKSIEVRALEALVEQLEKTITNLDKQVIDKCEETTGIPITKAKKATRLHKINLALWFSFGPNYKDK